MLWKPVADLEAAFCAKNSTPNLVWILKSRTNHDACRNSSIQTISHPVKLLDAKRIPCILHLVLTEKAS